MNLIINKKLRFIYKIEPTRFCFRSVNWLHFNAISANGESLSFITKFIHVLCYIYMKTYTHIYVVILNLQFAKLLEIMGDRKRIDRVVVLHHTWLSQTK